VLCLWAVAVVLLLAAALDRYVGTRLEQASVIRARMQAEIDVYNTWNTVLYIACTRRFTRAGLATDVSEPPGRGAGAGGNAAIRFDPVGGEIALDGTAYRGLGSARFSLQDETGLIALNSEEQGALGALLAALGTDEAAAARLLDTLADYRDADLLPRPNGAEQAQYAAAGAPPPPDRELLSAAELTQVLGWRDWLAAHPEVRLNEWFGTGRVATFNPNAAPPELLARMPGVTPEKAGEIVQLRQAEPFRTATDFRTRTSLTLAIAEDSYRFFPSDSLQLRVWRAGAAHATLLAWQLTPLDPSAPWQLRSIYRIALPPRETAHEIPGFLFGAGPAPDG